MGRSRWWLTLALLVVWITGCDREQDRAQFGTEVTSPAPSGSVTPHLARGPDGTIVVSWMHQQGRTAKLQYSILKAGRWSQPQTVAQGRDWVLNWADFGSVVPLASGTWAAHWLTMRPGDLHSSSVAIAISEDAGRTWSKPMVPHRPETEFSGGFVSLYAPASGAGVGALLLNGAPMSLTGTKAESSIGFLGMSLRSVALAAGLGLTSSTVIDDLVCDCCQTDIAKTHTGYIAAYRNRTDQEVRDVYVSRLVDGAWRAGKAVANDGWTLAGCPINGPAIAANDDSVVIAWFTAADSKPRVRLARSMDDGETFSDAIDIDNSQPIGRVDVEVLPDSTAIVSWIRERADGDGEISIRRVSPRGQLGPVKVIAKIRLDSAPSFPQMIRANDVLVFAWQDKYLESTRVKTVILSLSAID